MSTIPESPDRLSHEQLEALGRSSRRAGMLALISWLVIAAAFVFGGVRLSSFERRIALKKVLLVNTQEQIENLKADQTELEKTKAELEARNAQLLKLNDNLESQYTQADEQWLDAVDAAGKDPLQRPIETVVRPKAAAEQFGDDEFQCWLWLEIPAQRLGEIKSVDYTFNHPSFITKVWSSDNPTNGFATGYRGWGALARVQITLNLTDGTDRELVFNMARALGQAVPEGFENKKIAIDPDLLPSKAVLSSDVIDLFKERKK